MIVTRKRLLVDIFLTRRLSKSLAFCEFASVNFEPWHIEKTRKAFVFLKQPRRDLEVQRFVKPRLKLDFV